MKIDGESADPRAVVVWQAALAGADPKQILDFVMLTPSLQAGFRPGKISDKVALERVQGMLEQSGEMPASLRKLLCSAGLDRSLLVVLSEEAIAAAEDHMRDYFGGGRLYSAMLLSDREAVRARGEAGFSQGEFSDLALEKKEVAREALNTLFQPFLVVLGGRKEPDTAVAVTRLASARANAGTVDQEYAKVIAEMAAKSSEAKRLARELAQTKSELTKSLAQGTALARDLKAAHASLSAEQSSLQLLAKTIEQRVVDETDRRIDARVRTWLEPAEALALSAATSDSDDMLGQAEALLSQQKQADRRYGLWSKLARERDDCLAMIDRLSTAQRESIQPLPELAGSTARLMARVVDLEKTLGLGDMATALRSLPPALAHQIRAANSLDELASLRAALQGCHRLGLLQDEPVSEAYRLIEEACWSLYSTQAADSALEEGAGWHRELPLHALQRSIRQGSACLLLIDGHNALFKLRVVLQLAFEGSSPGMRARRQLAEHLATLARQHRALDIHLWYDGEDAQEFSVTENLVVRYSGGTGKDRADGQIIRYLNSVNYMSADLKESPLKVLVTGDRRLAEDSRALGAVILAPEELAILVASPSR